MMKKAKKTEKENKKMQRERLKAFESLHSFLDDENICQDIVIEEEGGSDGRT